MKLLPKNPALMALLALFAWAVDGFWRMPCTARTGLARIDPLISYGSVSEHIHTIHGSSGFSETAGYDDLVGGDCTSCQVSQDKSAYWTPPLYFQDASTGKFELVIQEGGMLAYYLIYPNADDPTKTVHAFPEGFRMIAGDTNQRNFTYPVPDVEKSLWTGELTSQAFLSQAALGFNCLNYGIGPEGSLYRHFLPDKAYLDANCKDGVRFELMFPSCWDGENDPVHFKKHVAYPSQVMTGTCPDGFPKRLVSLFYETIWRTQDFVGKDGQFVIANGDPTGYGYHGDFMMGWNETFLQQAVDECRNESGKIEDCSLFDIQGSEVYGNCNINVPNQLIKEKVVNSLDHLPGNVAIAYGPEYAKNLAHGDAPEPTSAAPVVPTLSHSDGTSIAYSETLVPGAIFAASSSAPAEVAVAAVTTDPVRSFFAPATTPAPVVAAEDVEGQIFFSTDYKTNGLTVNEVLWIEDVVTVTIPYTSSATTTIAGRVKRHEHKHRK